MTEWARLPDGRTLVAGAERAWLHEPGGPGDPFAGLMTHRPGVTAEVGRLLSAAIALGRQSVPAAPPVPALTPVRWAWRLIGLYHLTTHTPRLLRQTAHGFERGNRPALAAWARERATEEAGHDALALRDLAALGYDGPALVARLCPPAAARLLRAFHDAAAQGVPLGVLGYAHTVEHLATRVGSAGLARVRAALPAGVNATRCLRVHSSEGADAGHVLDNEVAVASLSGAERVRVARDCYRIAALAAMPPAQGVPDDAALADLIGSTSEPR
jgi:hypothetical protein